MGEQATQLSSEIYRQMMNKSRTVSQKKKKKNLVPNHTNPGVAKEFDCAIFRSLKQRIIRF